MSDSYTQRALNNIDSISEKMRLNQPHERESEELNKQFREPLQDYGNPLYSSNRVELMGRSESGVLLGKSNDGYHYANDVNNNISNWSQPYPALEDAHLVGETRQAELLKAKEYQQNVQYSEYFKTKEGEEIKIASYSNGEGQNFYRVIDDSHEIELASGGPYASIQDATSAAKRELFQILNERETPDQGKIRDGRQEEIGLERD